MGKRLIYGLAVVFFILVSISFVVSQSEVLDSVPGGKIIERFGEFDENTGLPSKFSEYRDNIEDYRTQDSSYLLGSWTAWASKNRILGPVFFYTEKFFSFFNLIWRYSFGMNFSWSLAFFLHVFIWGILVYILFKVVSEMIKSKMIGLLVSVIIASLVGAAGVITKAVNIIEDLFDSFLWFTIFIIVLIVLLYFIDKYLKMSKKEAKAEELKRARDDIKVVGRIAKKSLE